jgi:hypothetical protein
VAGLLEPFHQFTQAAAEETAESTGCARTAEAAEQPAETALLLAKRPTEAAFLLA